MKDVISQLIDDFQERELPRLQPRRDVVVREMAGKASVIIGMRRVGKTYLCFQKINELLAAGTPKSSILYLNFEDERLLALSVQDLQVILDVYFGKFPESRSTGCHFFFDEIQRIPNWELFVRRLLDTENAKVFLTGSSSKLLSTEIATSLRGRGLATEVFPFSFAEFLRKKGTFSRTPATFGAKNASLLRHALSAYFVAGGFPEVQEVAADLRVEVLQGYINTVLLKDVIERHHVSNTVALRHLVASVMHTPGGKFSVNKFHNTLNSMGVKCGKNDIYEHLDFLADAYLFYRVPLHSHSEKARLVNPAKIYTVDTGLLQAMRFRHLADRGHLLENLVFMHLRAQGFAVEYVQGQNGVETDFLARHPVTGRELLLQVCWDIADRKTYERELRGLRNAMAELGMAAGTIISWDDEVTADPQIQVLPAWKWLLQQVA